MRIRRHAPGLAVALALTLAALPGQVTDPLKIGACPANPPWQDKTEAGTFDGLEVAIGNEIARRMGTKAQIEGHGFKLRFVACASCRADMVISSLTGERPRWRGADPWAVQSGKGSRSGGLGLAGAGGQHADGRVVGKIASAQGMASDGIGRRFRQGGGFAGPIRQDRAVEVETFTLEDPALAIQRKRVGMLADQFMGPQTRPRATGYVGSGA